ncbi:MAG: hypothetical protein ACHQ4J_00675 [Candidatus Binatia bacterium]
MRNSLVAWLGIVLGAVVSGCALVQTKPSVLASSLEELAPHADGDHFVYIWERFADGQRLGEGIEVEHVSATGGGEFEVTVSEDGQPAGRLRVRDDGHALLLLSEDDLSRNMRLSYDPPLPQLTAPLLAAEQRSEATATVSRLADGHAVGTVRVTQITQARAAQDVHSSLGEYKRGVLMHVVRTLYFSEGATELQSSMMLVPGIGEVRSEGAASGAPVLRRALACALIGGHSVGNCQTLQQRLEKLHDAGPTDVY